MPATATPARQRAAPLHAAAAKGHTALLQSALSADPGLASCCHAGWTLLHRAAAHDQAGVVEMLVGEFQVPVDLPSPAGGFTPLMVAVSSGSPGSLEALLSLGADAGKRGAEGASCLRLAAAGGRVPFLRALARGLLDTRGGDAPLGDVVKWAPLAGDAAAWAALAPAPPAAAGRLGADGLRHVHRAVVGGDVGMVRDALAARPADVSARDAWGRVPMHWAAMAGAADVAELLLRAPGGEESARCEDAGGRLPAEFAARLGDVALYELLAPHAADQGPLFAAEEGDGGAGVRPGEAGAEGAKPPGERRGGGGVAAGLAEAGRSLAQQHRAGRGAGGLVVVSRQAPGGPGGQVPRAREAEERRLRSLLKPRSAPGTGAAALSEQVNGLLSAARARADARPRPARPGDQRPADTVRAAADTARPARGGEYGSAVRPATQPAPGARRGGAAAPAPPPPHTAAPGAFLVQTSWDRGTGWAASVEPPGGADAAPPRGRRERREPERPWRVAAEEERARRRAEREERLRGARADPEPGAARGGPVRVGSEAQPVQRSAPPPGAAGGRGPGAGGASLPVGGMVSEGPPDAAGAGAGEAPFGWAVPSPDESDADADEPPGHPASRDLLLRGFEKAHPGAAGRGAGDRGGRRRAMSHIGPAQGLVGDVDHREVWSGWRESDPPGDAEGPDAGPRKGASPSKRDRLRRGDSVILPWGQMISAVSREKAAPARRRGWSLGMGEDGRHEPGPLSRSAAPGAVPRVTSTLRRDTLMMHSPAGLMETLTGSGRGKSTKPMAGALVIDDDDEHAARSRKKESGGRLVTTSAARELRLKLRRLNSVRSAAGAFAAAAHKGTGGGSSRSRVASSRSVSSRPDTDGGRGSPAPRSPGPRADSRKSRFYTEGELGTLEEGDGEEGEEGGEAGPSPAPAPGDDGSGGEADPAEDEERLLEALHAAGPGGWRSSDAVKQLLRNVRINRRRERLIRALNVEKDREWVLNARRQQLVALKAWRNRDPAYLNYLNRWFAASAIQRNVRRFFRKRSMNSHWRSYKPDSAHTKEAFRAYMKAYDIRKAEKLLNAHTVMKFS